MPQALLNIPDVSIEYAHLALGDYLVDRALRIERKTLLDFSRSLVDGRLLGQAARLARSGERVAMILEGSFAEAQRVRVRREAIQGAIISITIVLGIPLLRSQSPDETARLMCFASRQLGRPHAWPARKKRTTQRHRNQVQSRILQGFPFIGPARAERLLQAFGNVRAVIDASEEQLSQIEGIGKRIAPFDDPDANLSKPSPPRGESPFDFVRPKEGLTSQGDPSGQHFGIRYREESRPHRPILGVGTTKPLARQARASGARRGSSENGGAGDLI